MRSAGMLRRMHMLLYILGTMPLTGALTAAVLPECPGWTWAFAGMAAALLFIMPSSGKTQRILWMLCDAAVLFGGGLALLPWRMHLSALLLPAAYVLLLLPTVLRLDGEYMGHGFRVFALLAFFALYFAVRLPDASDGLIRIQKLLQPALALFLADMFLILNSEALYHNGLYGAVPLSVRRPNTALTVLFSLLAVLAGFWSEIQTLLENLWYAFIRAAASLFPAGDVDPVPETPAPASGDGFDMSMLAETSEPNPILKFLEEILLRVFPYVLTALLLAALFFIFRRAVRFLQRWLRARAEALEGRETADFIDEVEDTRDASAGLRFRRRVRAEGGDRNDPRARIRLRYRRLLRLHREWNEADTARERLADVEMAGLYEKARYSEHPVTSEEADRFCRSADEKKQRAPY